MNNPITVVETISKGVPKEQKVRPVVKHDGKAYESSVLSMKDKEERKGKFVKDRACRITEGKCGFCVSLTFIALEDIIIMRF